MSGLISRNEIIRLLNNLKLSKFHTNAYIIEGDIKAVQILYTLRNLIERNDYPNKFDIQANGALKPDIICYLSPDPTGAKTPEDILAIENKMSCHQVGIEHFYISSYSFKNKNGKISSKISELENRLYYNKSDKKDQHCTEDYTKINIKDKVTIYESFNELYKKHFNQLPNYEKSIIQNGVVGNTLTPDGGVVKVPVWFLIECDDTLFLDSDSKNEIPIFFTDIGYEIIKHRGLADGYIYYGNNALYIVSSDILNKVPKLQANVVPIEKKHYVIKNKRMYKYMGHYYKIIKN